ncbi:MAG: nuclear transport factor 2 family protein [Gemmatimonadota bacterium]
MSRAPLPRRVTVTVLGFLLVGCAGTSPRGPTFTPAHVAAIKDSVNAALEAYRVAFVARDFDRVISYYAEDPRFRWFENGELRYGSRSAVAAALRSFGPTVRSLELAYFDGTVTPLAPGVAAVSTRFVEKVSDSTGALHGFAGVFSATMIHGDSGWHFLVGHTSVVVPHPAAADR